MRKISSLLALLLVLVGVYPPTVAAHANSSPTNQLPQSPAISTTLYLPAIRTTPAPSVFGVEMQSATGLEQMAQAGTSWIRRNAILWDQIEAVKGTRNWSLLASLDAELIQEANLGIQVILIVRNTPTWAQKVSGSTCGPIKPEELASFASFMHDLVARYSASPYRVKYWEVGNEPDAGINTGDLPFGCWGDSSDAYYGGGYYAQMLKQVYPQIKSSDPNAQVILGGLLLDCDPTNPPPVSPGSTQLKDCTPSKFLEGILQVGGQNYFDGISFHTYDYYYGKVGQFGNENWHSSWDQTGPTIGAKIAFIKNLLQAYQVNGKYILATEVALLCWDGCDSNYEITKAYDLVESYTTGMVLGLKATVWYDLFGYWRNSGLLFEGGQPRPAYQAYQFMSKELNGSTYSREVSNSGVRGYAFQNGSRSIWVLWSINGNSNSFNLPSLPTAVYDVFGKQLAASQTINVSTPVYVELTK